MVTNVLARFPKGRLPIGEGLVKINLGSGLHVAPGWINVDASLNAFLAGKPDRLLRLSYRLTGSRNYYSEAEYVSRLRGNRFIHHDLRRGVPIGNSSADFCYCSHFLEHLYLDQAVPLLREVLRVLKPDGVFRIAVPDLDHAVGLYRAGDRKRFLQYFFLPSAEPDLSRHRYMYDYETLADTLKQAGFVGIVRCKYREGTVPDLAFLDNRPDETLFVEARR